MKTKRMLACAMATALLGSSAIAPTSAAPQRRGGRFGYFRLPRSDVAPPVPNQNPIDGICGSSFTS